MYAVLLRIEEQKRRCPDVERVLYRRALAAAWMASARFSVTSARASATASAARLATWQACPSVLQKASASRLVTSAKEMISGYVVQRRKVRLTVVTLLRTFWCSEDAAKSQRVVVVLWSGVSTCNGNGKSVGGTGSESAWARLRVADVGDWAALGDFSSGECGCETSSSSLVRVVGLLISSVTLVTERTSNTATKVTGSVFPLGRLENTLVQTRHYSYIKDVVLDRMWNYLGLCEC